MSKVYFLGQIDEAESMTEVYRKCLIEICSQQTLENTLIIKEYNLFALNRLQFVRK